MRRRGGASLVCGALALALALGSPAGAETLVFRDAERGKVPGKVLAEFEDLLFVALDGEAARFVPRAELEAIIDDAGTRYDAPPAGIFARVAGPTPRLAATDLVGDVHVRRPGKEPAPAGEGPLFLGEGDALLTGEAGLARVILPSGSTAKLAPETELQAPTGVSAEQLDLLAGAALVETGLRPLALLLRKEVALRVGGGSRLGCEQQPDGARHVLLHDGTAELVWSDLRVVLTAGLGVELVVAGDGRWRLTADEANLESIEVRLASTVERLEPGASKVYGATAEAEELWRLSRAGGELLVRRGPRGALTPLGAAQRERLALAAGDALAAGADGDAILARVDGALARLAAGTTVEIGAELVLLAGQVSIEATEAPVFVATPAGGAQVSMGTLVLSRVSDDEVEARSLAGVPELSLGSTTELKLEAGAAARVRRSGSAATQDARVDVDLTAGRAVATSRAHRLGPDARFRLSLVPGQSLGVTEGSVASALGADGVQEILPTLHLPGGRTLAMEAGGVGAAITLDPAWEVAFENGARVVMTQKLWLGLGKAQGKPELRFRSGPRVRLSHPTRLRVHNPRLEVFGQGDAVVGDLVLLGDASVRLEAPTDTALVVGARDGDRFEVPFATKSIFNHEGEVLKVSWADQRRLWVEDRAPAVQARLADAADTLFLTMPGAAPLGLPAGRGVTVLATGAGEFVILSDDQLRLDAAGLELLTGAPGVGVIDTIARDRSRDLLDVPPPDSPSGP